MKIYSFGIILDGEADDDHTTLCKFDVQNNSKGEVILFRSIGPYSLASVVMTVDTADELSRVLAHAAKVVKEER